MPVSVLLLRLVGCAASFAATQPPATAGTEPSIAAPAVQVDMLTLHTEGMDAAALTSALRLRLPHMRVREATGAALRSGELQVTVVLADGDELELTAVAAGCRSYRRTLPVDRTAPERAVATALAHWVAAIEAGRVTPQEAPCPTPELHETPVVPRPAPELRDAPAPAPELHDAPVVPRPEPASPVPPAAQIKPLQPTAQVATTRSRPAIALGPVAGFVQVIGLGRPSALAGSVGGAASLGLELRAPRGGLVGAELRVLDARAGAAHLTRLRAGLLGGYALVRGHFTLRTAAAVTVEPWWAGGRTGTLLGGAVRVTPGIHARVGPGLHMHAGVRLELAASVDPGSAAVLQLVDGTPRFRLGGLELGVGLQIGLGWDVRARGPAAQ